MGAAYDSQERYPPPRCLPGTRKEVLERIDAWVSTGAEGGGILWLHGPAGTGKSAIAQTVAEKCAGRSELAASFFFTRTAAGRNAIKHLFPTVAAQVALSAPEKRDRLEEILKNDPYIADRAWGCVDLMLSLFPDHSAPVHSSPSVVIIDGLDECRGNDDQCRILKQVSFMIRKHHLPLRFLVVSRSESHLCEAFEEPALSNITNVVSLYGDFGAREDVSLYLRNEFARIYKSKRHRDVMQFVDPPWPSNDVIELVSRKSEGYFIYASTVIRFVDEEYFSPTARLEQVIAAFNSSVVPSESTPFAELDQLYIQILSSYPTSQLLTLKNILGYVVVPSNHMGIETDEIEAFLGLRRGQVNLTLRGLRSVVSCEGYNRFVLIHASFGDFLLDKARSKDLCIDAEEWFDTAFRNGFSLGCDLVRFMTPGTSKGMLPISSLRNRPCIPSEHLAPINDPESLSIFLGDWFSRSSRQDKLVNIVREGIEKGLWQSGFMELDFPSGMERAWVLSLLSWMVPPECEVRDYKLCFPTSPPLRC